MCTIVNSATFSSGGEKKRKRSVDEPQRLNSSDDDMMQHFQYQIEFNEEKDLLEQSVQPQTMTESKPGPSGQSNINNDEYIDHLYQYQRELNSDNEDENKENINRQNIIHKQLNIFQPEVKGKGKGKGKKSGKLYSEHFPCLLYTSDAADE